MVDTGLVLKINDNSFEKVVKNGVTLVDFWAEWCMPCRIQGPILDKVASEIGSKARICKLDVDENPDTASKFGVTSIPTLILFKNGEPIKQFVGVQRDAVLLDSIGKAL